MADAPPPSFRPQRPPRRPQEGGDQAIPVGRPGSGSGRSGSGGRPAQPPRTGPAGGTTRKDTPPRGAAAPPTFSPARQPRAQSTRPQTEPRGPSRGASAPPPATGTPKRSRAAVLRRRAGVTVALVLVLLLAWPVGLLFWANGKIEHVDALSGTPDTTPGTTYLLAGSDARGGDEGIKQDGTTGQRSDTIMLLHVPTSGPTALISLPRDTYVDIPGHGPGKLNAAYAYGGPALLVSTVEQLTGMHVDHYAEVGLGGVSHVVNAVGGVRLCFDPKVDKVDFPINDRDSKLKWTKPGCKTVDGTTAVAYARMRKADREGDIGRARRQRELISAVSAKVSDRSLVLHPSTQVELIDAGLGALTVDEHANIVTLGRLALAFRAASGKDGVRGTPPISNPDYRPGGVGSTVLLDPDTSPAFFASVVDGTLDPGSTGGVEG